MSEFEKLPRTFSLRQELCAIDFALPVDMTITRNHNSFEIICNKLEADFDTSDIEECDMCLNYRQVIAIGNSKDPNSHGIVICPDCLEKLIKIRKAL